MSFTIRKRFSFSASHQLLGLPDGHQCGRLHGHNYVVYLELAAETLDDYGFVVDFGDLKPFGELINETLDHRHLNDVLRVQPTAEYLAAYLHDEAERLFGSVVTAVAVEETPTSWAEYRA